MTQATEPAAAQVNSTLKTIHSLRTIHGAFTNQVVTEADLGTILDAAVQAANASGRQSYSIVVVDDRDTMRALCGYTGSHMLLFCVDFTRVVDTASRMGQVFNVPDLFAFITGSTDTILAAQTAAIAAKSLGIDSLFTNGIHRGDLNRVYTILDLPREWCFPLIALVLGYADTPPAQRKGRLRGPGIVHRKRHRRLASGEIDELIAAYDDPAVHLGLSDTWREEGFAHYLDWFYAKWSARQPDTAQFYAALRTAGFLKREG